MELRFVKGEKMERRRVPAGGSQMHHLWVSCSPRQGPGRWGGGGLVATAELAGRRRGGINPSGCLPEGIMQ